MNPPKQKTKPRVLLPANVQALIKELGFVYSSGEGLYRLDAEGFGIHLVKLSTINVHFDDLAVWVVYPDEDDDGKVQYSQSGIHSLKFTKDNGTAPLKRLLEKYGLEVDKILRIKRLNALLNDE